MTFTKKIGFLIGVLLVLGIVLYVAPVKKVASNKEFKNAELGIAFTYPANYVIEERELGNGERAQRSIVLTDEQAAAQAPINSEGPTAISFDFYQNNLDMLTADQWVNNNSNSNFKLGGVKTAPLVIDGREAFTYSWDGLYRGISGALTHGDWIMVATVTTLTPDDHIAEDFREVIRSLRLSEPAPITVGAGPGSNDGEICIQVITPAKNNATGEVRDFPTPCDVPTGWTAITPQ